ncbi:hypothetical protein B0H21DRAFT_829027 [Amylocystis lapponica]|nr:hypothetical protein B0H21DRAFT_829027 [Amylocystis lapponica]
MSPSPEQNHSENSRRLPFGWPFQVQDSSSTGYPVQPSAPRMRQAPQAEGGDSQLERASGTAPSAGRLGFNPGEPTRSGSIMEGQRQPAATPPSADRPPSAALVPAASRLQSAALVPSSGRLQSAASLPPSLPSAASLPSAVSLPSAASLPSASTVSTSTRTIRSTSPNEFPRIVFYHVREARLFGISPAVSLFRAQRIIPDGCLVHKFTGTIFRPEPLQFRRPDGLNTMERCRWKMFGPRMPMMTAGLHGDHTPPDPNVFLRKEEALAQAFIKAQEKGYRMLMGETQSEVDEEDKDAAPVVNVDKGKQRQVNPALPAPQHDAEVVSSSSRPVRYVFAGVVLPERSHRRLHSTTAATSTTSKRPRRAAAIAASAAITSSSAAAGTGHRPAHPVDFIDLQAVMGGPADPIDIDVIMGGPTDPIDIDAIMGGPTDPIDLDAIMGGPADPIDVDDILGGPADPIDVDDILGGPAHPINTDAVWCKSAGDINIDIDDDMGISDALADTLEPSEGMSARRMSMGSDLANMHLDDNDESQRDAQAADSRELDEDVQQVVGPLFPALQQMEAETTRLTATVTRLDEMSRVNRQNMAALDALLNVYTSK